MGTAQDEQRRLWVPGLGLEIRPIHVVNARLVPKQGGLRQSPAIALGGHVYGVVHRREQQDVVAGAGEGVHRRKKRVDHTGGIHDPFRTNSPAVAALHPSADRGLVLFGRIGVAQNAAVQKSLQPLDHLGHVFQLHIRHGKGDHVLGAVIILQFPPLHAAGPAAMDDCFKIIFFHITSSISLQSLKRALFKLSIRSTIRLIES